MYEVDGRIVGYECKDDNLTQPCTGSARCHRVPQQINEVFAGRDRSFNRYERAVNPCPTNCQCSPIQFTNLLVTCQQFFHELLPLVYGTSTFVLSKRTIWLILQTPWVQLRTLSTPLQNLRHLQLDLGFGIGGSSDQIRDKIQALFYSELCAAKLTTLCVSFTTSFGGMKSFPLDSLTIQRLSRFRNLTRFQLTIKNVRDCYLRYTGPVTAEERTFLATVPHIEALMTKFVTLARDGSDNFRVLSIAERQMLRSPDHFVEPFKRMVQARRVAAAAAVAV